MMMTSNVDGMAGRLRRRGGFRLVAGIGLAAAVLVLAPAGVRAATVCGTLITNVVTATMHSGPPDFVPYAVSYNATATVQVGCPPAIQMGKYADWQVASSGQTITFTLCVDNQTNDSVWGVTITDRLPTNVTFVSLNDPVGWADPGKEFYWYYGPQSPDPSAAPTVSVAAGGIASNSTITATMPPGAPPAGQGATYYIRWTIPYVGPNVSACILYRARVL